MATKKTTGAVKPEKNVRAAAEKSDGAPSAAENSFKTAEASVDKKKNYVKISVTCDVTLKTVSSLKKTVKQLIDEKFINMVFDLSGARYVDSSGLGFFIGTLKTLKEKHGALHITGLNEHVKGLFNLINLTNIFEIFEEPKDAAKF